MKLEKSVKGETLKRVAKNLGQDAKTHDIGARGTLPLRSGPVAAEEDDGEQLDSPRKFRATTHADHCDPTPPPPVDGLPEPEVGPEPEVEIEAKHQRLIRRPRLAQPVPAPSPAPEAPRPPTPFEPGRKQPISRSLDLSVIKTAVGIQGRAQIDQEKVAEYAQRMQAGDDFPPVVVFRVDGEFLLVDGFHRYHAAERAGRTRIAVDLRPGTRTDAIKFAIGANARHGLQLKNCDKRHIVTMALRELAGLSDHAIAHLCKVSHPFVGTVRGQLETVSSCDLRTGLDGKKRKAHQKHADGRRRQRRSRKPPNRACGHPLSRGPIAGRQIT